MHYWYGSGQKGVEIIHNVTNTPNPPPLIFYFCFSIPHPPSQFSKKGQLTIVNHLHGTAVTYFVDVLARNIYESLFLGTITVLIHESSFT